MKTPGIISRLIKNSFGAKGIAPTPHLRRRPEFDKALLAYKPSAETLNILAKTTIVTLTAPSATGRNTIINALLKTGRYHFIVSDTTRPPRQNSGIWEQNGVEYFFRDEDEMLEDIKAGRFIEAEVIHSQQVSGISAREVARAAQEHRIAINDVDIEGGINIAKLSPAAITICLLPPSFAEWIARMKGRSDFEPIELYRRLYQATKVLRLALAHEHFIFVINDKLEDAIEAVDDIATKGTHHDLDEQRAHRLAEELYHDTTAYLKKHAPEDFHESRTAS